jgi:regulator of cell morphogenesis and NO signaling
MAGMTTITRSTTLAELVVDRPSRTRLFERLGLDYCCGGKKSLEEASAKQGLDVDTVIAFLQAEPEAPAAPSEDWATAPIADLTRHIVDDHHAYLRAELPRISALLEKVVRAHGRERTELPEVRVTFEAMRTELERHMVEEEQLLFPVCLSVDKGGEVPEGIVERFEHDHETVGAALARIRELTGGFDLETVRCNTHRATVSALEELESDVHQHVHEENNILFPRTLAALA